MPVLKIKKDGVWEELGGTSPADGGNADTLDGKHASEFASATDVVNLQNDKLPIGGALLSCDFVVSAKNITDEGRSVLKLGENNMAELEYISSDGTENCVRVSPNGVYINNLQAPASDNQPTTKAYVDNALANFSSGKTLTEHLAEEDMILSSRQYGDALPDPGTPGRIFFLKVSE